MRRATRRLVAFVTLLGLLMLQGTVAAHACPVALAPATAVHHVMPGGDGADCAGMMDKASDTSSSGLCLEHCQQGGDANNAAASLDVAAVAPAAFLVPPGATPSLSAAAWVTASLTALGNSPPPLLLSRRLRI